MLVSDHNTRLLGRSGYLLQQQRAPGRDNSVRRNGISLRRQQDGRRRNSMGVREVLPVHHVAKSQSLGHVTFCRERGSVVIP
jgi:hypothetical protein